MSIRQMLIGGGVSAFVFNQTISANTNNYDLRTAAISGGWDQITPITATVTINSGVVVGSGSTGSYAFNVTGSFPAGSLLTVVNNGTIAGKGGNGGNGAYASDAGMPVYATAGTAGGPAFYATAAVSVQNNGTIGGGGGGGGGGGEDWAGSWGYTYWGAGGGGGGGAGNGSKGYGTLTTAYLISICGCTFAEGQDGSNGTGTSGGNGGAGGDAGSGTSIIGGTGGNGGSLGSAGASGAYATAVEYWSEDSLSPIARTPGGGGGAGACIVGNGNITWLATGTRLGSIS